MTQKGKIKAIAGTSLIAATVGLGLILALPSEPSYQGQSVNIWFRRAGSLDAPFNPEMDREAFRAMSPQAIPFLVSRLEKAPSKSLQRGLAFISSAGGEVYRHDREKWQGRAAYVLGEIGPAAKSAESNLIKATNSCSWSLRGHAMVALMKIRQEPPDPLFEKLKDTSDGWLWFQNAMMVGDFGTRAEAAVPILLEALHHTNNIIQAQALVALGMIGRQPNKCIPAIASFLRSPNASDRQNAMGALLAFGTNAVAARQAIQRALSDSDPWVRIQAACALRPFESLEGGRVGRKPAEPNDGPTTPVGKSDGSGGGRHRRATRSAKLASL